MECKTRTAEICFANFISNLFTSLHISRLGLKQFPELFHSPRLLKPINHCVKMLSRTLSREDGLIAQTPTCISFHNSTHSSAFFQKLINSWVSSAGTSIGREWVVFFHFFTVRFFMALALSVVDWLVTLLFSASAK